MGLMSQIQSNYIGINSIKKNAINFYKEKNIHLTTVQQQ